MLTLAIFLLPDGSQDSIPPDTTKPLAPLALHWTGFVRRMGVIGVVHEELVGNMELHSGEQFRLELESNNDCYVYVINVDGSGALHVLFPHAGIAQGHKCQGGRRYSIPDGRNWYTLDEQEGLETIYLVACYDRWGDFEDLVTLMALPDTQPTEQQLDQLKAVLADMSHSRTETRDGRQVLTRGIDVRPAKPLTARQEQEDGSVVEQAMSFSLGTAAVVTSVQFTHRQDK